MNTASAHSPSLNTDNTQPEIMALYNQLVDVIKMSSVSATLKEDLINKIKNSLIIIPHSKPPVFGYVW